MGIKYYSTYSKTEDFDMFKVFGEGRLVADPELVPVNQTTVCRFTLAINETRKVNGERIQNTHYFDCEAWDSGGKAIADYAGKGDLLVVVGKLRQQRWEDKVTGQKRSKVIVRVDEFSIHAKHDRTEDEEDAPDDEAPDKSDDDEDAPF